MKVKQIRFLSFILDKILIFVESSKYKRLWMPLLDKNILQR